MKLIFISDSHTYHDSIVIPEGDVLIACGDVTIYGEDFEMKSFLTWFGNQKPRTKIFINGNHEVMQYRKSLGDNPSYTKLMVDKHNAAYMTNIIYLENSGVEIEGIKFWGSPYTPYFYDWAYLYQRSEGEKVWAKMPDDVDVLITHGPPFQILDKVAPHKYNEFLPHAGCRALLARVQEVKPKFHAFGHIHTSYGMKQVGETTFINAATCDAAYKPVNAPIVVDYE